jgi:hypothetical protein
MKYIWCKSYLSCIRISHWKSLATLLTCSISVEFKTYKGYPPREYEIITSTIVNLYYKGIYSLPLKR